MASDFGTVTADPVLLTATAEQAIHSISVYRQGLERIASLVANTVGGWDGEAGQAFRSIFETELARAQTALDAFEQYPKDLLEYAGLYEEVVRVTEGIASSVSDFSMV